MTCLIRVRSEQLGSTKASLLQGLATHRELLRKLDDLDETMSKMLAEQQAVQNDVHALLDTLNSRLTELEDLEGAYVAYRRSYARLLQEMARRDRYRADMEEIVHGMLERLDRYREGTTGNRLFARTGWS
jgi:autophagy-related protein 17